MREWRPAHERPGERNQACLLQHADNPVAWHPWGPEALERARSENKPILLSVGYSACHWCHVMAHESSEDETTAAALTNAQFVNIKVDREERPDLGGSASRRALASPGTGSCWPPIPSPTAARADPEAVVAFEFLRAFILRVRRIRAELDLPPRQTAPGAAPPAFQVGTPLVEENLCAVMPIGRIEFIEPLRGEAVPTWRWRSPAPPRSWSRARARRGPPVVRQPPGSHQCLRPSCRPAPAPQGL
jgi:hypothetical protein